MNELEVNTLASRIDALIAENDALRAENERLYHKLHLRQCDDKEWVVACCFFACVAIVFGVAIWG